MPENPKKKSDIRVLRQKDVAEVAKDVLNNKSDITQIESSLHRSYKNLDRSAHGEREAMKEILNTCLLLAKSIGMMAKQIVALEEKVSDLEKQVV